MAAPIFSLRARHLYRYMSSAFIQSIRRHNTEGDYIKTTVGMLSKDETDMLIVEGYSQIGFRISHGIRVIGPCVMFAKTILHWNVQNAEDVDEEALSLFTVLEPKIDLLILGKGDVYSKINNKIIPYLRSKKITVEILTTDQACATFNFMNSERRLVAAALIPPAFILEDHHADISIDYTRHDPFIARTGLMDPSTELHGELHHLVYPEASRKDDPVSKVSVQKKDMDPEELLAEEYKEEKRREHDRMRELSLSSSSKREKTDS